MNCVRCLADLAPGAKFCGNCGLVVAQPSQVESGVHDAEFAYSPLVLEVTAGPGVGKRFPLTGVARLGRANGNEIQLFDAEVSRLHAVIYRYDQGFAIVDQKSINGTYVNGVRIAEPSWINPGDKISIGRSQILVSGAGEGSPASVQNAAVPSQSGGGSSQWLIFGVLGAVGVFLLLILAGIAYFLFF